MGRRGCCANQLGCCFGSYSCRMCCSCFSSVNESTSSRMMYVIILFIGIAIMCVCLTPKIEELLPEALEHFSSTCLLLNVGEKCNLLVGYLAVYRIAFILSGFFFLMSLGTMGVKNSQGLRANFHNGCWLWKILILIGITAGLLSIPNERIGHFQIVWMYIALIGGVAFIVIQLWLLVFFARSLGNKISLRVHEGGSPFLWYGASSICSFLCFSIAFVGSVALFYFFASWNNKCDTNKMFIGINAGLCLLLSVVSALNCCGPKEIHSALLQAGIISVYITYLTWTAISSVPREPIPIPEAFFKNQTTNTSQHQRMLPESQYYCGPSDLTFAHNEFILPYVGVAIVFFTVVYSSIGTSSDDAIALGIKSNVHQRHTEENPACCACIAANDKVSHSDQDDDVGGQRVLRNEWEGTVYNYSLFHVIFCLASMYIMMTLTAWFRPEETNLTKFNQNWATVWIKMSSSWACVLLYLVALPFRNFGRYNQVHNANSSPVPVIPMTEVYERETVT